MAEKSTIDLAEELLAKARTEADRAMTLADQARPAGPSRRFAEGPALPSAQKVTEGSTNTFRSWQQIPAWCIGAGGLALAFFLAVTKFDSIGAWITVILILTLAVVAMFRGPADIALGTGGGGGASGGEGGNHAEEPGQEPGKAAAAAAGDGASQPPSTGADPVAAAGPVAPADLATAPDGTGTSSAEPVPATAAPGSPTRPDATGAVGTVAAAPTSPFPGPGGATGLKVMAMGLRYPGPSLLITPRVEDDFGARIEQALAANAAALRQATQRTRTAREFRGERPHQPAINLADPTIAGWTYLLHADDPRRDDIVRILRPLAEHRRMPDPTAPLLYREEEDWQRWLEDSCTFLVAQRPRYILAVGGPAQIPFHLQSFLDVAGMVGRIDFEDLADFKAYVQKVLRLEQGAPAVSPAAVFFAPDSGQDADGNRDPTYYSRRYMAAPLAQRAKACGFGTRVIEGDDATRDHLVAALGTGRPALVYTASHGIAAIGEDLATQQRLNGAVCCQRTGHETGDEWLFTGDDVPADPRGSAKSLGDVRLGDTPAMSR